MARVCTDGRLLDDHGRLRYTSDVTMTRFIGIDLASGEGSEQKKANETGVVALDRDGAVLDAGWTIGIQETVAWVQAHSEPSGTLAFVDAQLIVDNEVGQRVCERQVGQRYGRWQVYANSTNLSTDRLAGVALRHELEQLGWKYNSGHAGPPVEGLHVSECYPYTTLVGTAELYAFDPPPGAARPERPRYKRKPGGMSAATWHPLRTAQCDDLLARLGRLRSASPPLDLLTHPATAALINSPSPRAAKEYKHREDLIDAVISAWTALMWTTEPGRCQVLGPPPTTGREATIIAPAVSQQLPERSSSPCPPGAMTSHPDATLTDDDLAFLRRPLQGFLTVAVGPTPAQPRPVWFEAGDDRVIRLFSETDAPKVRRLRADPRASFIVAAPVGERERWVSVTGTVTFEPGDPTDLVRRTAGRYWDLTDPARSADLTALLQLDQVLLALHPEKVRRFTY